MVRRAVSATALIASLVALTGCDGDRRDWSTAQFAPSLEPSWGVRETDGRLQIWTGSPCVGITQISLSHNMGGPKLVLKPIRPEGAAVEYLTLGGPYPGLAVAESWPDGLDWRSADQLVLQVDGKDVHFGSTTQVSDITAGSPGHPQDTYWFDGVGWMSPADVAAQDGKTFTAVCTPDPLPKS